VKRNISQPKSRKPASWSASERNGLNMPPSSAVVAIGGYGIDGIPTARGLFLTPS
jgi:hypothetical protein